MPVGAWRRKMLREFLRYISVGVLNSLLGLSVIWFLLRLQMPPLLANAGGYAAGLLLAYILNRRWTFQATPQASQFKRFILAFIIAYGVNLGVLIFLLQTLHLKDIAAQTMAVAAYTICFFLLSRYYVFRRKN